MTVGASIAAPVERVDYHDLRPEFLDRHRQGDHIAVIGPTGHGKTTVAIDLLEGLVAKNGAYAAILANKRRDPVLRRLGWPIIPNWPARGGPSYEIRTGRRVIVWPPYGQASTTQTRNRGIFEHALDQIIDEGSWSVYFDEIIYFTEQLGLRRQLDEYWNTARSSNVTVLGSSQGTTWIPRAFVTQQSWLVAFRPKTRDGRRALADIGGDRARYEPALERLAKHEFLIVNTQTDEAYISRYKP